MNSLTLLIRGVYFQHMQNHQDQADVETSSDQYARRFAGASGAWMLAVQKTAFFRLLIHPQDMRVLDVGGGHGQLAGPLCEAGANVTVLGSREVCAQRLVTIINTGRCAFVAGCVTDIPFPDRSFDVAISFRLLAHCSSWQTLIRELCRVARHTVIVDYPTLQSINAIAPALFGAKRRVEKNTRVWKTFDPREVTDAFEKNGFVVDGVEKQFFWPMALHRILHCPSISMALEGVAKKTGITGRWGSPVIIRATRQQE